MVKCRLCERRAIYNVSGQPPRFCSDHKDEDMIEIPCGRLCQAAGCRTSDRCICAAHNTDGMIHRHKRRCEAAECTVKPSFNLPGEPPRYCAAHNTDGMIHRHKRRCEAAECTVKRFFNLPGEPPRYCAAHNTDGMIHRHKRRCDAAGCTVKRFFNLPGEPPRYCAAHKMFCRMHKC
jgi:hypothetical protein